MLNPNEEYVVVPLEVLERILRYAYVMCEEHCAERREARTCYYMYKLTRGLGLPPPPCAKDYGEFKREDFEAVVRSIVKKYKVNARVFVESRERRGVRSLEEQIDLIEAKFALDMLQLLDEEDGRRDLLIVRGRDLDVKSALKRI